MNVVLWLLVIVVQCAFAKNKDQEGFSSTSGNNFGKSYTNLQNYPPTGKASSSVNGDYLNEETGNTSITSPNVQDSVGNEKWNGQRLSSTVRDQLKNNEPLVVPTTNRKHDGNIKDQYKNYVPVGTIFANTGNNNVDETVTKELKNISRNTESNAIFSTIGEEAQDNVVSTNTRNLYSAESLANTDYSSTTSSTDTNLEISDNSSNADEGAELSSERENSSNSNEPDDNLLLTSSLSSTTDTNTEETDTNLEVTPNNSSNTDEGAELSRERKNSSNSNEPDDNLLLTSSLSSTTDTNTEETDTNLEVTPNNSSNTDEGSELSRERENSSNSNEPDENLLTSSLSSTTDTNTEETDTNLEVTPNNSSNTDEGSELSRERENSSNSNEPDENLLTSSLSSTTDTNTKETVITYVDNISEESFVKTNCTDVQVNFTLIETSSFNVTLEWEALNTDCLVDYYMIYLNDQEYNETSVSTIIEGLYGCTTYTVSITAIIESVPGPKTEATFTTVVTDVFRNYTVLNLTVEPLESTLKVTWEPPAEEIFQCVETYYLNVWHANESALWSVEVDSTCNNYTFPLIGCMEYGIQVYPKCGENYSGRDEIYNYNATPIASNAPEYVTYDVTKSQANITWKTDDTTKTRCDVLKIFTTCIAPEDNNMNVSWVIRKAEVELSVTEQAEDFLYSIVLTHLSPFTNYTCETLVTNEAGNSSTAPLEIKTQEDVPSEPLLTVLDVSPRSFKLVWNEPEVIPGIMTSYGLHIDNGGPQQIPTKECSNNVTDHYYPLDAHDTNFIFEDAVPYHIYKVSLYGVDGAGNGTVATKDVLTNSTEPDIVENPQVELSTFSEDETYNATVKVTFEAPCNTNGVLKYYEVSYNGVRNGFANHQDVIRTNQTTTEVILQPARDYTINITVVTENFVSQPVIVPSIHSKPGVPALIANMTPPSVKDTTTAHFTLSKTAFSDDNGDIVAYSLFLLTTSGVTSGFGFWNGTEDTWPEVPRNATQLTPNLWNPFNDGGPTVVFTIGANSNCNGQNHCNQPLNEDTKYWLMVRALTSAAYKDSPLLYFQTEMLSDLNLALILGLTFGLLALAVLMGFLVYLWRRKREIKQPPVEEKKISTTSPASIPVQKYTTYYASLKESYNIIKDQYTEIGLRSKEVAGATSFATLPENKRKNRYTNILAYDETRVMLKIDEDDEISSDYINASYIKGYSGKVEYIATQGPLEHTARDFWKMILQENVSVIAMVSQFVEQSKEKCYQYFPNNHESVYFGESLEVKCSTELHFGTYCVRTLQIRKGAEQRDVVHMQFLEWPDFGVPQGTDNMLQFCGQLREKVNREGGLIAVHCSAGVGRTGTLIALDILLQTIDDHRDINIYKTVFDLRKQRTNMVQTEKQYMFIHTCVKDYIETPPTLTNDVGEERIYENVDVLKSSSLKKNLIESELESAL